MDRNADELPGITGCLVLFVATLSYVVVEDISHTAGARIALLIAGSYYLLYLAVLFLRIVAEQHSSIKTGDPDVGLVQSDLASYIRARISGDRQPIVWRIFSSGICCASVLLFIFAVDRNYF